MQNELSHHGVLGQKWGIRRYQNKDGSLTAAGRRRAAKQEAKELKEATKQLAKNEAKTAKKPLSELTDDELRQRINRLQMEQRYADLTKAKKSKGRQAAEEVLANVGKEVAKKYITKFAESKIDKMIDKMSKKNK